MPHLSKARLVLAAALLLAVPGVRGETAEQAAATLYALNCMGCHFPPEAIRRQAPFLVGQFAHTESGRMFFIRVPDNGGKPLGKEQNALLLSEILSWKKSCPVVLQNAAFLQYTGPR
ncbi:hypothetical protein [Sulfuritalea sp.]|uniref:hypothetical protein n=1 Tax=Sulfuritalea sp. TaxID=2480090 RepID=UPI00286E34C2|nr:hypothetical protein [Sulfuritalea sp.]